MTLLIIEDDSGLAELMKEKMEDCGAETICVSTAEEALNRLKENTPYLMILDFSLPDMTAKEFIAELKIREPTVPPFIVCTGQGDEQIAVDMMKLGARDYIVKGSHFLDLLPEVVRRAEREIENEVQRKRAEAEKAELEVLNRKLQKAESLGLMAGAIAHTFNNQLGVVIGNLEMAMMELSQGASPLTNITAAMKASNKAAEVSGLMLTYLGQTVGKRESLDLSQVCSLSLPLLQTAIPKDPVMESDLPSPGPAVSANVGQIQQVLTNLVTNAREAVGDGRGAITLTVKTVSPADIPASLRFPSDWQPQGKPQACLEVRDTGCGIADQDIEKLFDPFFSTKFTGRGMGLAVVLGIVKAHGGAVTVESELERGSIFRVFLPVSGEEVPRRPDQAAPVPEAAGGGTILLVEDEEMVRTMAAAMLSRLGFTVLAAKDGVEAVEVFRQHQDEIRCLLCDLTMPRLNGWETLTALRKLAPNLPVVLASGYDQDQVMTGDHPEWPQVFLGKPFKLKGLSDAIGQALVKTKYKPC